MDLQKDLSLIAAAVAKVEPHPLNERREWQGIPGIERARNGRLWAVFYTGGEGEGPDNYVLLITSEDDGQSWSDPLFTVAPPGEVRAYDPCLWHDPSGRLWLFWAQSFRWFDGRCGVWASVCDNSQLANPQWSEPCRIADGIMMNKPTVLDNNEWLLPIAVWVCQTSDLNTLPSDECFSNVYVSDDEGATFHKRGAADIPNRFFDEHMIVERKDKSLWMLVRTYYGIGESISRDGGRTWSPGKPTGLGGPNSRFFVRRLQSGNLLLVNHYGFHGRSHLTAMLSDDDGQSWKGFLLLDERSNVSYPDGVQADDGTIYIIYDHERSQAKEILMARFTEEDVLKGECVSLRAQLMILVNRG